MQNSGHDQESELELIARAASASLQTFVHSSVCGAAVRSGCTFRTFSTSTNLLLWLMLVFCPIIPLANHGLTYDLTGADVSNVTKATHVRPA